MFENCEFSLKKLTSGAFLTSGSEPCNVMTIGWGFIGYMWRKPVFIAPVRESRFTKGFIDKSGYFAVSIPNDGEMKKELALAGSKSGRDTDKLAMIAHKKAEIIDTEIIENCVQYYQCKVMAAIPVDKENLSEEAKSYYCDNDMHVLYIGEIL